MREISRDAVAATYYKIDPNRREMGFEVIFVMNIKKSYLEWIF